MIIKSFLAELWPQILINIGISVAIPLLLHSRKILDEPQSILFGAMLTIIATTIEVLWYVKKIADRERVDQETFSLKSHFSRRLAIIQQAFGNIVDKRYGEKDLFIQHFNSVVGDLEAQISRSDSQNELTTDSRHVSNIASVLESLDRENNQIRIIHFLKDTPSFYENLSKTHFYSIYRLVPKQITDVKMLMVFSADQEFGLPPNSKLIRFHSTTAGYLCKAIRTDQYNQLVKIELHGSSDFVIYGDKYLCVRQSQHSEGTPVTWSKEKDTIRHYIDYFENTWGSEFALLFNEPAYKLPISIDELFDLNT